MQSNYLANYSEFAQKAKQYASQFNCCAILDSCNILPALNKGIYKLIIGFGNKQLSIPENNKLEFLYKSWANNNSWLFGAISYNIKNEIEKLDSSNKKCLNWPELVFFMPETVITVNWKDELKIYGNNTTQVLDEIFNIDIDTKSEIIIKNDGKLIADFNKASHSKTVNAIKNEISDGNVYEMNLCSRFLYENISINEPYNLYSELIDISPAPFSAYLSMDGKYIISASPERYLAKNKSILCSQPIKGTMPRGENKTEDEVLKSSLFNSIKDRAENVMIVDLVRNDLARTALAGTVNVEELFGIYTYSHLHQMISTISSIMEEKYAWKDALFSTFPMGSMTGAPKIAAMNYIDKFEKTDREYFSGALGYISPDGDFDFNVLIRSLFYESKLSKLAYYAGGAITIDSEPEDEYAEMILKAGAIDSLLKKYI